MSVLPWFAGKYGGVAPVTFEIKKVTSGAAFGANPTINLDLGADTAGRKLFAAVTNILGFGTTFATDCKITGGASMTEEVSAQFNKNMASHYNKGQLYWIENTVDTGTTPFEISISAADWVGLTVWEITGSAASPFGAIVTKTSSFFSGNVQTTLTTTVPGSIILTAANGQQNSATPASGITEDVDNNFTGDRVHWAGHRDGPSAQGYTVGCTFGGLFGAGGGSFGVEILSA